MAVSTLCAPSFKATFEEPPLKKSNFGLTKFVDLTPDPLANTTVKITDFIEPAWLNTFYRDHGNATQGEDIYTLIEGISTLFEENDLYTIDQILNNAPTHELSTLVIICLARSTCNARDQLHYWKEFIDKASARLSTLGKNPSRVFRGII